jgi:hypothetical protein
MAIFVTNRNVHVYILPRGTAGVHLKLQHNEQILIILFFSLPRFETQNELQQTKIDYHHFEMV